MVKAIASCRHELSRVVRPSMDCRIGPAAAAVHAYTSAAGSLAGQAMRRCNTCERRQVSAEAASGTLSAPTVRIREHRRDVSAVLAFFEGLRDTLVIEQRGNDVTLN